MSGKKESLFYIKFIFHFVLSCVINIGHINSYRIFTPVESRT